jgi:glycerol-3-phosphate dehydrogenase
MISLEEPLKSDEFDLIVVGLGIAGTFITYVAS